jgi:peroxiredoxin 2/4
MKKANLILLILLCITVSSWSQKTRSNNSIPLIGDNAPAFTAESTIGQVNFPTDYPLRWKIIFSHPADFTPVCSSEILEIARNQKKFEKMNTQILVVSSNGVDDHRQWVKSLDAIGSNETNFDKIAFPLLADQDHSIARMYGMLHPESNSTKDVRGVFIVDPSDKIRAIFFYPMGVGRNIEEITRTLAALQTTEKEHVMTPANWQPGSDVILPYPKTGLESDLATSDPSCTRIAWYLWLQKRSGNMEESQR